MFLKILETKREKFKTIGWWFPARLTFTKAQLNATSAKCVQTIKYRSHYGREKSEIIFFIIECKPNSRTLNLNGKKTIVCSSSLFRIYSKLFFFPIFSNIFSNRFLYKKGKSSSEVNGIIRFYGKIKIILMEKNSLLWCLWSTSVFYFFVFKILIKLIFFCPN